MVVRSYVFETRGGALLAEVDPKATSWSVAANQAEEIELTLDMNALQEQGRDWRNLGTPWKHSLAVDVEGRLFGGPIMPHNFSDDSGELQLTARGIRVALARRSVLPVSALGASLTRADGSPNPVYDTNLSGLDLGSIGKRLVQQAVAWPGWTDIPIVLPADREGSRERSYAGVDRKNLDEALDDLSNVQNGPDIRFQLRWAGTDAFEWVYQSGTEQQPRLQGSQVFAWNAGAGSGLTVETDPTHMGSLSWSEGGRSVDEVIIRQMYDSFLIDRGFPLLELESDASANTSRESTLDEWNVEKLRVAYQPWEFWSFRIRADEPPYPREYNVGDLIDVDVSEDTPVAGGYVAPGTYRRRIAALAGDDSEWIDVTCGAVY